MKNMAMATMDMVGYTAMISHPTRASTIAKMAERLPSFDHMTDASILPRKIPHTA